VVQEQVRGYREVEQRSVEQSCVGSARGGFKSMTVGLGTAGVKEYGDGKVEAQPNTGLSQLVCFFYSLSKIT